MIKSMAFFVYCCLEVSSSYPFLTNLKKFLQIRFYFIILTVNIFFCTKYPYEVNIEIKDLLGGLLISIEENVYFY